VFALLEQAIATLETNRGDRRRLEKSAARRESRA